MSRVGKLEILLTAQSDSFLRSIREAQLSVRAFGLTMRTGLGTELASAQRILNATARSVLSVRTALLGAAAAAGAFAALRSLDRAAQQVDELGKAAKRLGVSAEQLSVLRFAAGESGIEFEALATMASRAGRAVAEMAAKGQAVATIGQLRVRLTDANGQVRNLAELLPDIARGIESVGSEAEQLRLSQQFFGRGGGDQFITLLKESGTFIKGLAEQTERARRLGVIFTEDQVTKLTAYRDALGRVQEAWLGVKVRVMTDVAPALTEFLDNLALRTAQIPEAIRGIRNALAMAAGDGPNAEAAREALDKAMRAAGKLLISIAIEAGYSFGWTVIETLRAGMTQVAISMAEALNNLFPQLKLSLDPRVNAMPEIDRLENLRRRLNLEANQVAAFSMPGASQLERESRQRALDATIQGILGRKGTLDDALTTLQKMIAAQERALTIVPLGETTAALRALASEQAGTRLNQKLDASVASLREVVEGFASAIGGAARFSPQGEMFGPPASLAGGGVPTFAAVQVSARDAARNVLAEWRRTAGGLEVLWTQLGTAFRVQLATQIQERAAEAAKSWQDLKLRFYPEERVAEDIANIRQVHAALQAAGLASAETAQAMAEMIGKVQEEAAKNGPKITYLWQDMRDAVRGFSESASDAFADLLLDGKANFEQLAKSWAKMLISMALQALVLKPIFDNLGLALGKGLEGTSIGQTVTSPATNARGNAFSRGDVVPFAAGGVVTRPTFFPMRGQRVGLMGEAGPEAIMPLERVGGSLGVRAAGAGVTVQVIDQRGAGAPVEVQETRGTDGQRMIRVIVRDEVRRALADGSLDAALRSSHGLPRRPNMR